MNEHTKEPWTQGVTLRTKGTQHWTTEQVEANNAIERRHIFSNFSTTDEGKSRVLVATCQREEDASRIVACVNACAVIKTEYMEKLVSDGKTIDTEMRERIYKIADVTAQRDELLAAAKNLRDVKGRYNTEIAMKRLIETIAKVESEK